VVAILPEWTLRLRREIAPVDVDDLRAVSLDADYFSVSL
jgi:hypothetical protein